MIPIAPDSAVEKPSRMAPTKVANTPNWAAAPSSRVRGLAISGPKSVSAPTPMKISGGKISSVMPCEM